MYKKILSYRPSLRPNLVFLIIPVLVIFIFISKYFDQYSENGESKDQELENNLITVKDFLFNQFNSSVTKVELKVRNGDSIQRILYDQKISPADVNNVINALRREYNIGALRNDQKVYLIDLFEQNFLSQSPRTDTLIILRHTKALERGDDIARVAFGGDRRGAVGGPVLTTAGADKRRDAQEGRDSDAVAGRADRVGLNHHGAF